MSSSVATGVPGLDELLSGGFPEGRVVLVLGGPGTGKTVLASQFLYKGIYDYEEHGIFVSLDERKHHYYSEMQNFGWDFKKAEEEAKFAFIDATRLSRSTLLRENRLDDAQSLRGKQLPIDRLVETLDTQIHHIDAKRVTLDTLASLFYRFPDPIERRIATIDLVESLSELGTTTIVTTELRRARALDRDISVEEYIAHGVILLETLFSDEAMMRGLHVEKMRGTKITSKRVPYTIEMKGIEVFPHVRLFDQR